MRLSYLFLLFFFFLNNCGKEEKEISVIKETSQELELVTAYNEAYEALNKGDPYFAARKFLEAELLFPQSKWASKSAIMASYSYYLHNYYSEAIANSERYLKTYPTDKDLIYAHYLIAMCYYEIIEDEKRDTGPLLKAQNKFNYIITNFPNTEFAMDAQFKVDFIEDLLASKEMYLGRHYIKKEKWIAAINRFKYIIEKYDQTMFVEEALHRLVEINYKLGLVEESQKYANVLGYNYLSSDWYKRSYKVFNKDYNLKMNKPIKKDKFKVMERFKKLFD